MYCVVLIPMTRRFVLVVLGVLFVIILGVLVRRVGYVGIRRVQSNDVVVLQVVEPLIPGTSTMIRWAIPWSDANQFVDFRLHTELGSTFLGQARIRDTAVPVKIPCDITPSVGNLRMTHADTQELISSVAVSISFIGPDCFGN